MEKKKTGHKKSESGAAGSASRKKELRDALHESEELYRTLVQTSPEAIAVIDLEGNITDLSRRALEVYGFEDVEELFDKKAYEMVAPEDLDRAREIIRTTFRKGLQENIELTLLRKDGSRFTGEVNTAPVKNSSGKPTAIIITTRDITDRKETEGALSASEERFRAIFEKADSGMVLISPGYDFVRVNPAFCRFLGYTDAELLNLNVIDITHPDDLETTRDLLGKVEKKEINRVDFEKRYVRKDGTIVWGHVTSTPFFDSGGRHLYSFGLIQDITKRKKAEEDLRESEERYRTLAETARDFIFVVGEDMRVRYVNGFGAKALGLEPEDIVGKPLNVLFPSGTSERQIKNLKKVFETGEPMCVEDEIYFLGRALWLETWLIPLKNEGGKITAVQGISRDTTERKNAEQALRESEYRYRTLFESSPDSITILGTDGRIIDCNSTTARISGYTIKELIGKHYTELQALEAKNMDRYLRLFMNILNGIDPGAIEVETIDKNGDKTWKEVHVSPLERDGRTVAFQLISRDITERKRLEQAKINFLGSVSHELRTPLSLILGYSQMLLKENLPPSAIKKLKIIHERGRQELKLVEELITIAKFESGETRYEMADVNIWNFLRSYALQAKVLVETLVQKRFHSTAFTFAAEISDNLKGVITRCDEEKIRQALDNLVENAVKYSDRRRLEFKLTAALDGNRVLLAVMDKGMGIPESEKEAIFKPFYQIRTGVHPLSDGMGKGLSIVKEHIEAHGGEIRLESSPEKGSVFFVSLPVKEIVEYADTPTVRKILVVDDDRDIVEFIENLLVSEGFDVCAAFNRNDALSAIEEEAPDLVLLDIQLPDGDGADMCGKIKSEKLYPSMLVYLISAKAHDELKILAEESGADGFISKPFEIDSFLEMIDNIQR